jgi:RNA polymerase sigma factor (sigma-70 family)
MEPTIELVLTDDSDRALSGTLLREAGKLAAFIKARVGNAADAEDILQDVLFEFVQAYRLPESIEQVSGWLFRVARNRIIDRFRKRRPSSFSESATDRDGERGELYLDIELPSAEGNPEAEFARSATLAALQLALEELPASQREVFIAHEIEGWSFESLSRRDGVPVNTLIGRKRYAVLHLRRRLQVFYDELES